MKKLIALIKITWYFSQSEKAIRKAHEALRANDMESVEKFYDLHLEYEAKAKACNWREKV